jgi:hypothetical protein
MKKLGERERGCGKKRESNCKRKKALEVGAAAMLQQSLFVDRAMNCIHLNVRSLKPQETIL